jgi:uncharacterized protein
VVWHQLNSNDLAQAEPLYTSLFGWRATERVTHPEHGTLHHFRWTGGDVDAGAFLDIQGRAGRHAHWLFSMPVPDLERALGAVRAAGGVVVGPFALPDGKRVAVCDDPQGAAFALKG